MSGYSLRKEWDSIRHQEFPWTDEVTKWSGQKAIQDLGEAFTRFFKKTAQHPTFKKKGKSRESFYLGLNHFSVAGNKLRVPKLGFVKMAETVRFPGKAKSVTISSEAGEWFVSISVDVDPAWEYKHKCQSPDSACGIDLGLKDLATIFNGTEVTKIENQKPYRSQERKTKRLHRSISRKKKGSSRRWRAKRALAKHTRKIARRRSYHTHKLTSSVVKRFSLVGIETLNVKGMAKTKLAKSVHDASFGEIVRQLEYKAELAGGQIAKADRWFPSSKLCSSCGTKKDKLSLAERDWTCPACGTEHDRDGNAAKNLYSFARRHRENQNACGGGVRPKEGSALEATFDEAGIGTRAVNLRVAV